jgi:hypothetical protein
MKEGPRVTRQPSGNAAIGSTVKRNFNAIGWQHVELPPGMSVRDALNAYQELGTVLAMEPDGIIEPIIPPVGRAVPSAPIDEEDAPADDGAVGHRSLPLASTRPTTSTAARSGSQRSHV